MSKVKTEKLKPRATPKYGKEASHRTEETRKYQCNAPLSWERLLRDVMKERKLKREGEAIRECLYAGLKALKLSPEDPHQVPLPLAKAAKEKPARAPKAAKAKAPKVEA